MNASSYPFAPRLIDITSTPSSTAHSIPAIICENVPVQLLPQSVSTAAWYNSVAGATPTWVPLAAPPATVPLTCVPWPL